MDGSLPGLEVLVVLDRFRSVLDDLGARLPSLLLDLVLVGARVSLLLDLPDLPKLTLDLVLLGRLASLLLDLVDGPLVAELLRLPSLLLARLVVVLELLVEVRSLLLDLSGRSSRLLDLFLLDLPSLLLDRIEEVGRSSGFSFVPVLLLMVSSRRSSSSLLIVLFDLFVDRPSLLLDRCGLISLLLDLGLASVLLDRRRPSRLLALLRRLSSRLLERGAASLLLVRPCSPLLLPLAIVPLPLPSELLPLRPSLLDDRLLLLLRSMLLD